MQTLKDMGVWKEGPFSIHMTAGPDTITIGDKLGFDLPNNPVAQQFLKEFDQQGHQIGSHCGWIHDLYGENANETNQTTYLPYLGLNKDAIEKVIGHSMTEYSAPQGNNPLWALNWLEQNGFRSYYSLSHTGATATRSYRKGVLKNPTLWAFPVVPYGIAATFEEFESMNVPLVELNQWYKDLIDFSAGSQTSRLIYAHPPGASHYPSVITALFNYAKQKQAAGLFKWYTMAQISNFLDKRTQVQWDSRFTGAGQMQVRASHPADLGGMAWVYPKKSYAKPIVIEGAATVLERSDDWLVQAGAGKSLLVQATAL
jgi:hypothetical protein